MKSKEAISRIMETLDKSELLISSCGMISREVHEVKDRPGNFYNMGAMGSTLGIGIGVALNTKKKVSVIAGDGDLLMDLGTLFLFRKLKLPNLWLFIIDNNAYATTGGQPTCSDAYPLGLIGGDKCWVYSIRSTKKGDSPRIPLTHVEIKRRFMNEINK